MRFKRLLLFASVITLLAGCDSSRRANRHIRKAIALDPTVVFTDTVRDTIYGERVDTIISLPHLEPQLIQGERGSVLLTYNGMDATGTPLVSVVAQVDTHLIEVPVERIKYITNPPTWKETAKEIALWVLIGLAILLILRRIIDKLFQ